MKIAFFISSIINMQDISDFEFGHSKKRNIFSNDERFRQTQYTIANIKLLFPEAKIFLFDVGENVNEIRNNLTYTENVEVISAEQLDPAITAICRSSESKGLCETEGTLLFLKHYMQELKEFDYIIKMSGRYFFTHIDKKYLTLENTDKYLCKNLRKFDWKEWWNYPDHLKKDGCLYWAPSQSYIVGTKRLDDFQKSLIDIKNYYTYNPAIARILDFEVMLYYYVLQHHSYIEIPWINGGWGGQDAVYNQY